MAIGHSYRPSRPAIGSPLPSSRSLSRLLLRYSRCRVSVAGPGGCALANCACPPGTINDIGPWFSRRYDGTTASFYSVSSFSGSGSLLSLLSLFHFHRRRRPHPQPTLTPRFSSSSFFVRGRERRQVGIRATVNSPAPLSALMSLLLFALLNAIRAYSVSLSPCSPSRPRPSAYPSHPPSSSCTRSSRVEVVPASHTQSPARARNPSFPRRCWWINARSRCYACTHTVRMYVRTCVRTARRHGRGRIAVRMAGIAISRRHASEHYCVISRTKSSP